MLTMNSHDRLLAEIRAEHAADKQFARDHHIGFTNHKSQYDGKVTLRQWAYLRGDRKCMLTRFPNDAHSRGGWYVVFWQSGHIEDEQRFKTRDLAIYSVARWLRGARMDS
jgi:hypothetical protein